jgi:glutamate N-acetyltransferase/amino-acid N-acetyltransferase
LDAVSVTAPKGFEAIGVAAGIKGDGALDLAIVAGTGPTRGTAVFTVNRAAAAPVVLSRRHLDSGDSFKAIVLNSGCANAATGPAGDAAALATASAAAAHLGCHVSEVFVASTGTIGTPLAINKLLAGLGMAAPNLAASAEAGRLAAEAIMTTDTVTKETTVRANGFIVGGMAKGAGMVRPDMATMLAVLTTDAIVDAEEFDLAVAGAIEASFHGLNIDGCPSTNDSVFALASGMSGVQPDVSELEAALTAAAQDLTRQLAADAEGATRVITIEVSGASDDVAARAAGRSIADSALVRASFYGGDPNWGRLLGALGAGYDDWHPSEVEVAYAGVTVARNGVAVAYDEVELLDTLVAGDFAVAISIGDGPGRASVLTTDLTPEYVRFNGERS